MPNENYGGISRVDCGRMAFAINHEMAYHLSDFMFVSSYSGYETAWDAEQLEPYGYLMGAWMHWDEIRQSQEVQRVLKQVALPR